MKPIVWMGKELTNYLIKEDGSVFNVKLNRWLKSKVPDTYGYMRYGLHVPLDFYEDYNYKINNPNGRTRCVTIRTHKALMNTFRPEMSILQFQRRIGINVQNVRNNGLEILFMLITLTV